MMAERSQRHHNRGLRKMCACPRRIWPKCAHSWHFNFKPKGGPSYRFSVDTEAGKHIESKTEAEALADGWRTAIRNGDFRRRADAAPLPAETDARDVLTLEQFGARYVERVGKPVSANHQACFRRFSAFVAPGTEAPYG